MKNLSIDTSSEVCGVSLLEDDKLIYDNSLNNGKTHSENLMPLIKEALEKNDLNLNEIDLISVVVGPGSFTGIRIGVATVKALAEVKQIKIAAITSLEALAENIKGDAVKVALIDAKNDQVYCGIFDKENTLLENYIADNIDYAMEQIKKYSDKKIIASGSGTIKHKNLLSREISNINFCDENEQKAENVGKVGYRKYLKNELVNGDSVMPIYLRKSQAERLKK